MLGTPVQAIIDTEDREIFVQKLNEINVQTIKSEAVENAADARRAAAELGYPVIVRAAYALGGLGSGFCDNEEESECSGRKGFLFLSASIGGEVIARLERSGVRGCTRPLRQLHHRLQYGELRSAGHSHRGSPLSLLRRRH